MNSSVEVQLLKDTMTLPDLTIGDAMDIAQISQEFNEKRLSAMIGHLSGDNTLAARLTAQERYYILLSHQSAMQNAYSHDVGNDDYLIDTIQADVPSVATVGDAYVNHLLGAHVCALEGICENVYEWVAGQMACQLSGNLAFYIGGDDEAFKWDALPATMTNEELSEVIRTRITLINSLTTDQFNDLEDAYSSGVVQLEHFVILGSENRGLTLIKQGGEGAGEPARFPCLDALQGTARTIAQCLA